MLFVHKLIVQSEADAQKVPVVHPFSVQDWHMLSMHVAASWTAVICWLHKNEMPISRNDNDIE